MATHPAIVTVTPRAPLQVQQVPTIAPSTSTGEVRVRVDWTVTTAFDLHQADGGLVVTHGVLGSCFAGVVVEALAAGDVEEDTVTAKVGDKVFGYGFRDRQERGHQLFVTVPTFLCGKIPDNVTPQEAITIPDTLITALHSLTYDLHIPLPWPVPDSPPSGATTPILVWGAASSAGQATLQVLKYWGYKHVLATASPQHHEFLKTLGATEVFDYRDPEAPAKILAAARNLSGGAVHPAVPLILDCIGSVSGSMTQIATIASAGSRVAVLLPVVIRRPSVDAAPQYSMDAQSAVQWKAGVNVQGVRTHAYMENELLKTKFQNEIMPTLVGSGAVRPMKARVVEGASMLERAENAMQVLREGVSGERVTWRVSGEDA